MKSKKQELVQEFTEKLEKEKRIKDEIKKVNKLFKDFEKKKRDTLEGLINDVAFLKINLQDIKKDLLEHGLVEDFEQGPNKYKRERPEVKIYTTWIKTYSSVMKQLIDLLPEEEKEEAKDELMIFLQQGKVK